MMLVTPVHLERHFQIYPRENIEMLDMTWENRTSYQPGLGWIGL